MVEIIRAGTRENPLAVGGHWQITNVGWGGGVFVACMADTFYKQTVSTPGTRKGKLSLSGAGGRAGGTVLAEKNLEVTTVMNNGGPPFTRYLGVMKFNRMPSDQATLSSRAFTLRLDGSITYVDPGKPPNMVDPFCGTSTSSGLYCKSLRNRGFGDEVWATVTLSTSTPAGSGSFTYEYQVAGGREIFEGIGTCISTTGSSTSIWYQDGFGNWVNTGDPCENLPNYQANPQSRVEGWQYIQVYVFPRSKYRMISSGDWTHNHGPEQIIVRKDGTAGDGAFGGPMFVATIPRRVVGQNSDFLPIFEDLPTADYDFRMAAMAFSQFIPQVPPQTKPKETEAQQWKLPGVHPLSPNFARYDAGIGTNKPAANPFNAFGFHLTTPIFTGQAAAPFAPGTQPPSTQTFTP